MSQQTLVTESSELLDVKFDFDGDVCCSPVYRAAVRFNLRNALPGKRGDCQSLPKSVVDAPSGFPFLSRDDMGTNPATAHEGYQISDLTRDQLAEGDFRELELSALERWHSMVKSKIFTNSNTNARNPSSPMLAGSLGLTEPSKQLETTTAMASRELRAKVEETKQRRLSNLLRSRRIAKAIADRRAIRRSEAIEAQLREDKNLYRKLVKILVLGAPESGRKDFISMIKQSLGSESGLAYREGSQHASESTGILETKITVEDLSYSFIDLPYQTASMLWKLGPFFQGTVAVLYVVDLATYDLPSKSDDTRTQLQAALEFCESLFSSKWFVDSPFVLMFNNVKKFQQKLRLRQPKDFLDYKGGDAPWQAANFILHQFTSLKKDWRNDLYADFIQADDPGALGFVLRVLKGATVRLPFFSSGFR